MKIKQLYQNLAVSLGLVAALAGSYACGDGSEPNLNPTEDAQVEVDSGNPSQDGSLEDKLVYPDANGDNEKPDAGVDTGYDTNLTDTYDGGLDASDVNITDVPYVDGGDVDIADTYNPDGGDVILTDTYIQPDGGDDDVSDGGQGIPPVVIIETKDEQGNVKDTFKRGEWVVWDASKSYDPDCEEAGTCGSSKGMDYCEWWDDLGNKSYIAYDSPVKISYGTPQDTVTATAKCYDLDDKLSSTAQVTINLID